MSVEAQRAIWSGGIVNRIILRIMGGSKTLPDEMISNLVAELEAYLKTCAGTTTEESVGISMGGITQPQINKMKRGELWGWKAVLGLSKVSGKTITELLGPTAPHYEKSNTMASAKVRELLDALDESGYGWAGKNKRVADLMRELRAIVGRTPTAVEAKQAEIREVAVHSPLGKKKRSARKELPGKQAVPLLPPASAQGKVGT